MTKEEMRIEAQKVEIQNGWDKLSREDLIIAYKVMAEECNRLQCENEALGDRIQAIGLLYEGFISNDGVFSEVIMAMSELYATASKDAKELFTIAYDREVTK